MGLRLMIPRAATALFMGAAILAMSVVAAAATDEAVPLYVIVQLRASPPLAGGSGASARSATAAAAAVASQQARVRTALTALDVRVQHTYTKVLNGFSIALTGSAAQRAQQLASLQNYAEVHSVFRVTRYRLPGAAGAAGAQATRRRLLQAEPQPTPPANFTIYNGETVRAREVNTKLGFTGKGVKVALIDSGVDYMHPDLGGGFGPGFRVAAGLDFVGDLGIIPDDPSLPYSLSPDADPRDTCNGHGTAVAGLVGASGATVGMAPEVTLGAYRVFSCVSEFTQNDLIIAALEQAYKDGMDIINLSLGQGATYPDHGADSALGLAVRRLTEAGIVVVSSVGNDGNMFTLGNVDTGFINVGASSDPTVLAHSATSTPGNDPVFYSQSFTGQNNLFPVGKTFEVATPAPYDFDPAGEPVNLTATDACTPDSITPTISGKVALVRRGGCFFNDKLVNVRAAGAAGILVFNSNLPPSTLLIVQWNDTTFPAGSVMVPEALVLIKKLRAGPVSLTFNAGLTRAPYTNVADRMAAFSSNGPVVDLRFSPSISAPGNFPIVVPLPLSFGGYDEVGGTSASAPEVAGCAALFKQARPGVTYLQLLHAIQNTAKPTNEELFRSPTDTPQLAPTTRQGAGVIDIYAALTVKQSVSPPTIALGVANKAVDKVITVTNSDTKAAVFTLSHMPTLSQLYNPDPSLQTELDAPAGVAFSRASALTVPAKGSATFTVKISPPSALRDISTFGGFIVLKGASGTYGVPYQGFKGDYQKINPLDAIVIGTAVDAIGTNFTFSDTVKNSAAQTIGSWAGASFDFISLFPALQLNLLLPAKQFTGTLINLASGLTYRTVVDTPYPIFTLNLPYKYQIGYEYEYSTGVLLPKRNNINGISPNFRCVLPNGKYKLVLSLTRALGTAATAIKIDVPELHFTVARPAGTVGGPFCAAPAIKPTKKPIKKPTKKPTKKPHRKPTKRPHRKPTKKPHRKPTKKPHRKPHRTPHQARRRRRPTRRRPHRPARRG